MESYYRIADHEGEAAIVPSHIAANEADRFVVDNVTDSDSNHTRFVVFKKGIFSVSESCKARLAEENAKSDGMKVRVPVYIIPKTDRPGILYEILKEFYEDNINLISIMSRPTKQEMGTYNFYIEIDGLFDRIDIILSALKKIKENNEIKILGIYSE